MLQAKNLVIGRGSFVAAPLTFEFPETGLFYLEGRNGTGKTTLFKTLLGRLPSIKGQFETREAPIGTVGVEPLLFETWTVEQMLGFYEDLSSQSFSAPYREWIQRFRHLRINQLSSGMKRQVELSIAFGLEFSILFLDEPFHFLDLPNRELLKKWILEEKEQRLIWISRHDQRDLDLPFEKGVQI